MLRLKDMRKRVLGYLQDQEGYPNNLYNTVSIFTLKFCI